MNAHAKNFTRPQESLPISQATHGLDESVLFARWFHIASLDKTISTY
jgi:hypothetical protein